MKNIRTLLAVVLPLLAPALHAASIVVTNVNDSGGGSLRQALADAAALAGADEITFAPGLSGQSIALSGVANAAHGPSALVISDVSGVTLDATALPGGLTLQGGAGTGYRCFRVTYGSILTLHGLTISGFTSQGQSGGAIYNQGTLTMTRCTLSGNSTDEGGAISNFSTLTLTQCSLSGNSASSTGGAIINYADATLTLTLTQCTLSGNSANAGGAIYTRGATLPLPLPPTLRQCSLSGNSAGYGGAIANGTTLTLTQCTLSGNSATYGGAIINSDKLTLNNTIAAGNTASNNGPDIYAFSGTITPHGVNLISDLANSILVAGPNVIVGAPLLAPLANYGGPTQTMALLPGSPARNAAAVLAPAITSDQRGFPIVGTPDIGAYEAGTITNFENFIWETLPATATPAQHAAAFDYDGDGAGNGHEWLAGTIVTNPASSFRATATRSGNNLLFSFRSVSGRSYRLWQSDALSGWTLAPGQNVLTGTGSGLDFTVPIAAGRRFYQVEAMVP